MPERSTRFEVRQVPADYQHPKNDVYEYTSAFVASVKQNGYEATVAKMEVPSALFDFGDDEEDSENDNDEDVSEDDSEEDSEDEDDDREYIELYIGYEEKLATALKDMNGTDVENVDIDFPDPREYMLVGVAREERTHYMMFDTKYPENHAGVPISPVCESKQVLLAWLTLNPLAGDFDDACKTNWKEIIFGKEKEEEKEEDTLNHALATSTLKEGGEYSWLYQVEPKCISL